MKRLDFICTFKSDIVLHASSNTEGKVEKLDYIPGSNFLGMVAREYDSFGADAFDVFHSGEVCFGDGHMLVDDEPTLHVPFSFQAFKGVSFEEAKDTNRLFVHHFLRAKDFETATKDGDQYKQQRVGFFTASGRLAKLEHAYRQKSAYDKKQRRSKDSSMFGYHALPAERRWAFSVTMSDDMATKYEKKIKDLLIGKKRLGKSKSAEYGLVEIENKITMDITENISIELQTINDNQGEKYLYLYAKSRLVLTDKNGVNSYIPSIESLGFEKNDKVKIDWNKSQIRTSRYTPYVGARRNFDPERLVIDKGSVIVVEVTGDYDKDNFIQNIQKPIGLYISEGHGEVIVNPEWLLRKEVIFDSIESAGASTNIPYTPNYDNPINNWLSTQREEKKKEADLLSQVFVFIKNKDNNVKNKKSQWGQIRSLCRQAEDSKSIYYLLFNEDTNRLDKNGKKIPLGFLIHSRIIKKWDTALIKNLKAVANYKELDGKCSINENYQKFIKLLSIYAPKEDDKAKKEEA